MALWALFALFSGGFITAIALIAFLVLGYMQSKIDAENEEEFKRAYEPFSRIDKKIQSPNRGWRKLR